MDGADALHVQANDTTVIVSPAGPLLGAEVSGVDLKQPLSLAEVAAIRAALLQHKVLFFRDQDISHEDHVRSGPVMGADRPAR